MRSVANYVALLVIQQLYFSEVQHERWASVIIDNNDPGRPRVAHAG